MGKKKIQNIGDTIEDIEKPKKSTKKPSNSSKPKAIIDKKPDLNISEDKIQIKTDAPENIDQKTKPKRGKSKIRSKKYQKAKSLVDSDKLYDLPEAIELVKKTAYSKFKSNVETHIRLNIDLSKSDEQTRMIVKFPKYLGKKPKILAITSDRDSALKAGATHAGGEELIDKIGKGWLDFNMVVAEPRFMPNLGKVAKILGTKGLMPNPKTGTISDDLVSKISEILAGSMEIKNDTSGIIHQVIGGVEDSSQVILNNFAILYSAITKNKISNKDLIRSIHMSASMGPSVKVNQSNIEIDKLQKKTT
ncbi:50S ribosomal protein L1 [Patescibacteria group bacterium]